MKFYITNEVLERQIKQILSTIRLSMNGIASDSMIESGLIYKKNYGVSIPRLKEIAKQITPNHDLAQRLWFMQIRETMILATLLEPIEEMTIDQAKLWIKDLNQIEKVEQSCMNLFSKLPFAVELAIDSIKSENLWEQITGFVLAARIYKQLNNEQLQFILNASVSLSSTQHLHLYKAIGLCLSRFCRLERSFVRIMFQQINDFRVSQNKGESYIFDVVNQEIIFLPNL